MGIRSYSCVGCSYCGKWIGSNGRNPQRHRAACKKRMANVHEEMKELFPRSPLVVHCKRDEFDVYIGRPSPWGNPYVIGPAQNGSQVIEAYRVWLKTQPELMERIRNELKGLRLGCWCRPKACHGDILAAVASGQEI